MDRENTESLRWSAMMDSPVNPTGQGGTGTKRGLTVAQLAREAGVAPDTIRYYEREGVLPAAPRSIAGYRRFPLEAVEWVRFLRNARELGFSVSQAGRLLAIRLDPKLLCGDARQIVEARADDLDREAKKLRKHAATLRALVESCTSRDAVATCPLLEGLGKPRSV
jgi:MerR family transcriptional regulator, copper efflux regulator